MYKIQREDYKSINKMALPVLTGTVVETVFSVADQAIIGRTSVEGYAAVGVVANILYLLTGTFGILSLAFSILFGKMVGEGDKKRAEKLFRSTITISLLIGTIFGIVSCFFSKYFFSTVYHFSGLTLEYACDYMKYACWGLLLNMLLFIFSSYFKNLKQLKIYVYATTVSLAINFVIDYTLVFGKFGFPKMGVKGAAIGTVVGLFINLLFFIVRFVKMDYIKYKVRIYKKESLELIKIYIPLLGQDFVECTLFIMLITSIITNLSIYDIASYNLIESITSIVLMPVYAYAGAALTLVTQGYAKKDRDKVKNYPIVSLTCGFVAVILIGGLIVIFPEISSSLVTNDKELIRTACCIFPLAIGVQLFNVINQVYKYCLQGTSFEKWVFKYSLLISALSCGIIYINVKVAKMGLRGVYIGLGLSYLMLGLGYYIKYLNSVIGKPVLVEE